MARLTYQQLSEGKKNNLKEFCVQDGRVVMASDNCILCKLLPVLDLRSCGIEISIQNVDIPMFEPNIDTTKDLISK
ncbi:hypothetical protein TNIN_391311 [Trichonephila inaurata madagascariensis]|uniref:Uncharacterized protein n=1 Tax=Trichonephila inaurata madagascariensis TaxID=2747483 RepID=A0A8X6XRB8_9ARAC|nr:hypothetical protein TNIN_391311 [Trichonephila inaurata madagascariensis]